MHTIFLVHGMGSCQAGWSATLQATIRKHYDSKKYGFIGPNTFDAQFKFQELTYNNHFETYLAEAQKQAGRLSKWSKLVPGIDSNVLEFLNRVVSAAGTANSNKFTTSHIGDVALFLATDVGELVKADLLRQLAVALGDQFDPSHDQWSIVGHSLGTRVVTEILQVGFTNSPSLRSFGKARVVMMIANVSRLLENLWPFKAGDVYHNAVFPSKDVIGVCDHYINVSHRLDPVAFVNEFDPPADFGDRRAFLDNVYHAIKLPAADITSKDIHAAEHYLDHPLTHTALFQYLGSGRKGPTANELDAAMTTYRQLALSVPISNVWRDSLANLKTKPFGKVLEILDLWEAYGDLLS